MPKKAKTSSQPLPLPIIKQEKNQSNSNTVTSKKPPTLSTKQIEGLYGDYARFQRSLGYFNLKQKLYKSNALIAKCEGTSNPETYRLEIQFKNNKVSGWSCSCPDWGNPCKHIGALLFEYQKNPNSFKKIRDQDDYRASFNSMTKDQLVNALLKVAEKYPVIVDSLVPVVVKVDAPMPVLDDFSSDDDDNDNDDFDDDDNSEADSDNSDY